MNLYLYKYSYGRKIVLPEPDLDKVNIIIRYFNDGPYDSYLKKYDYSIYEDKENFLFSYSVFKLIVSFSSFKSFDLRRSIIILNSLIGLYKYSMLTNTIKDDPFTISYKQKSLLETYAFKPFTGVTKI